MLITDVRKHYRFSPDAAQVVAVGDTDGVQCRLACFEPGQALSAEMIGSIGNIAYVLEGTGVFTAGERKEHVSAGGLVSPEANACTISNPGPGRLVVMIVSGKQS